jgi:hypothetical protein
MSPTQELQYRVLTVKAETAARARFEKVRSGASYCTLWTCPQVWHPCAAYSRRHQATGVPLDALWPALHLQGARQLHSMAVLLAQMMKRSVEVQRELAAARTAARTQHVLDTQLPLLERWAAVQVRREGS